MTSSKPKKQKPIYVNPPYFPSNHFFCLYRYEHDMGKGIELGRDAKSLAINLNLPVIVKVKPVLLLDLIKEKGHAGTTQFLKTYGDAWVVRAGNIFYKAEIKEPVTA